MTPNESPPTDSLLGNNLSGLLDCALEVTTQPVDASLVPENWEPPTPAHIAVLLPQYQIELLIGRGGMGAVYKGRQITLQRPVAIKVLPAELARSTEFVARFHREAQLLASLSHQGIVTIFDFGQTTEGHLYFVMEYVDGTDLYRLIHKSGTKLDAKQALSLTMQICEAMQYAHDMGVVHRDIKPANVLVTRDGRAKLADFGLAMKPTDPNTVPDPPKPGAYFDPQRSPNAASLRFTAPGAAMGTPDYAAPEVYEGKADARSDIYALGIMLYEMLTGAPPKGYFQLPSVSAAVDHRVDQVVVKAIEIDPAARYQKAQDMRVDVEAATKPLLKQAPPPPQQTLVQNTSTASKKLLQEPAQLAQPKPITRRFGKLVVVVITLIGIAVACMSNWNEDISKPVHRADLVLVNPTPVAEPVKTQVLPNQEAGQSELSSMTNSIETQVSPKAIDDNLVPAWLAEAKTKGGRLHVEGTCSGIALETPALTDVTEVFAKRNVGWLARRATGDIIWSVVQGGKTKTGTLPGARSISMDDEIIVIGNDGKAWRLASSGLALFAQSSANDFYDTAKVWSGASLYWGHFLFDEHHKLVHEHNIKGRDPRKDKPLSQGFFSGAIQTFSVGWVAIGLFQDGTPKGWALHPADAVEIPFPDSLRACIQADGICSKVVLLRTANGEVVASDCNPTSDRPPPVSLPPSDLKSAIRVRGGCEFKDSKVASLLCCAQMSDGTWRSWGDPGSLAERVATFGVALDVDATASDPGKGFLVWIEPLIGSTQGTLASVPSPIPSLNGTSGPSKTISPFFGTVSMITSHELWLKGTDGKPDRLYAIKKTTNFNRESKPATISDVKVGQQVAGFAEDDGAKHYTATKIDLGVAQLTDSTAKAVTIAPLAAIAEIFRKKDTNGDSKLSPDEFTRGAKDKAKSKDAFDLRDKDKDGFLTLTEFDRTAPTTVAAMSAKTPAPPYANQQPTAASTQPKLPTELITLDIQFQKLLAERVTTPFDSGVASLSTSYVASLDRERAKAQQAGLLDAILAIDAEKKLIANKQPMPETDDDKMPASIKGLRTTYRSAYAKLEAERDGGLKTLAVPLDTRLATMEIDLTNKGRSDDAGKVHEYRDDLRDRYPELQESAASAFGTAGAAASLPTKPKFLGNDKLINTLGMRFIRVTSAKVMFCLHETRRQDYAAYAKETTGVDESWKSQTFSGQKVGDGDDHPVVAVNYDDATAFCAWLSKKESLTYRLPTDKEWSYAVGVGPDERRTKSSTPESLSGVVADEYPWGKKWPPRNGTANYASNHSSRGLAGLNPLTYYGSDYYDWSFTTAPVMKSKPNKYILYDMGGNVWEWVQDWYNAKQTERVLRGGSWFDGAQSTLLSSYRLNYDPATRSNTVGFRCVVETPAN